MMSGRMTRGSSFLKAAARCDFEQFRGFALVEPGGHPGRLFAGQALAVEQIDAAIELKQDAAQAFQFLRQFRPKGKRGGRNAPVLPGEKAVLGQARRG